MFSFISSIAHRGNLDGPNPENENKPKYLELAFDCCFYTEADIWYKDGDFYLGHDEPMYKVAYGWLHEHKNDLYLHCKNPEAMEYLAKEFNCFWQQGDDYSLTSKRDIWVNIGKKPIKGSILVDLEYPTSEKRVQWLDAKVSKVCTDWARVLNEFG